MNYPNLLRDIFYYQKSQVSPHGKQTWELMHQTLHVPENCLWNFHSVRPFSKTIPYLRAELAWFFSGDIDPTFITQHAKLWDKIKNLDGTVNSNYGNLVFYGSTPSRGHLPQTLPPFEWAARALEADVDSRQGMVTYNTGAFNFVGNKDYICSQHQAFYIRNQTLLCYVALRSSDVIWGLPYNMAWWQLVYQMMHLRLKRTYPLLQKMPIIVTIYSAHIYEQHFKLVADMLEERCFSAPFVLKSEIPLGQSREFYTENLDKWLSLPA